MIIYIFIISMTYFAILGKHKQISLAELQYIQPTNLKTHGPIAIFDTEYSNRLAKLGGIIKRGTVTTLGQLVASQPETAPAIIGTNLRILGSYLKKLGYSRRFKELTLDHTDREVQDHGQEIIGIHSDEKITDEMIIGIVTGYQDIGLFEAVDFEKPSAGMGIGMMPAKLTLMMINIALTHHQATHEIQSSNSEYPGGGEYTIYDPFCGFGTTGFLANAHGYHFIGSDLNGSLIKPNLNWWNTHARHTDHRFTAFKHDATTPITKPFVQHSDVIVTEGWLGPIVTKYLMPRVAHHQLKQIGDVYIGFLKQADSYFENITICMTIPVYRYVDDIIGPMIQELFGTRADRTISKVPQAYERKGQFVTRQIIILTKKK